MKSIEKLIPDYKYNSSKESLMISFRMNVSLLKKIDKASEQKGWVRTGLLLLVLDLSCQQITKGLKISSKFTHSAPFKKISLRVPVELIVELDKQSRAFSISRTELINYLVWEYCG